MHPSEAQTQALTLIKNSPLVEFVTFGSSGFPDIRTMLKVDSEDFIIWMTTSQSSKKVAQILRNSQSTCYFVDPQTMTDLRLFGSTEIIEDMDTKNRLWQSTWTQYFDGPEDPEYILLKFTTSKARFTHDDKGATFEIEGIS